MLDLSYQHLVLTCLYFKLR